MSWKTILQKFGFNWSLRYVFYNFDWTTAGSKDVKKLLIDNVFLADKILHEKQLFTKHRNKDKIVMEIFKWVIQNIKYQTDSSKFGIQEKWENVDNILETKSADCESMSMLIFSFARAMRINPLKIKLVAGTVKTSNGSGGHAWIEYWADETDKWHILDAAYDPRNLTPFKTRIEADKDKRYLERWFEVTDLEFSD